MSIKHSSMLRTLVKYAGEGYQFQLAKQEEKANPEKQQKPGK